MGRVRPPMISIRSERGEDHDAIFALTRKAFEQHEYSSHAEQFVIEELRRAGALSVSLVAQMEGTLVGHVAFSPVRISDGSDAWYGLGPLSVLPTFQRKGIGTALVQAGLAALRAGEARGCVVLGEPGYYQRFGFRSDPRLMLQGMPPDYFMILSFDADPPTGAVTYHEAFSAGE
jgi:putative acetyltransferase